MKKTWWKEAIGYQIYPRSFKDSNGDGIGDIKGIISKLDYLKNLGIDVIWICPMYKSPNDDNGYDISDFEDILEDFGTIKDFDELLVEIHNRGMKLIIDLVVNHTSDEHEWFIESKSSKDNPKRDWYIWKDGKNGAEPNNWESIFRGSAWKYDEATKQYFLQIFTQKQPDLNWENEDMRKEIYNMINWWLDKGIDGFRVDAISHINKEAGLKDMPNPDKLQYVPCYEKHMNVDGIHKYLDELKENTYGKYDIMTVAEANGVKSDHADLWVSEDKGKFNMVFQFEHLTEDKREFSVKKLKEVLTRWQNDLHGVGWNALYIENHDIPRIVSCRGNDEEYWMQSAKSFGLNYFMQQGTPFIYQGQEIGMKNVKFKTIDMYDDVKGINLYKKKIQEGYSEEDAMGYVWDISRDNARTPMQWNSSVNAGFSVAKPWLPLSDNYTEINVEDQLKDPDSILNFYKNMITIRKLNDALIYGKYDLILEADESIYAYTRTLGEEKFLVICNLTGNKVEYKEELKLDYKNLLLDNYNVHKHEIMTEFTLRPWEARLYKI